MRRGKSLEKLVEHLEKVLAGTNVSLTAPKRLRDRTTGRFREHDAPIVIKQGHHELRIAIECRDRSRPVTVNQVEGFWKKCDDTGINQGIIVSTRGFYKSAKLKASHLGIRCFDLEQAKSFNWLLASGLQTIERKMTNVIWTLVPAVNPAKPAEAYLLLDGNGVEVSIATLNENARQQLEDFDVDLSVTGKQSFRCVFSASDFSLLDKMTTTRLPLKELIADIEYEVTKSFVPFDLFRYSDKNSGREMSNAALAKIQVGEVKGQLAFIRKEDQSVSLSFVPDESGMNKPSNKSRK
jgi:hypothetical protein